MDIRLFIITLFVLLVIDIPYLYVSQKYFKTYPMIGNVKVLPAILSWVFIAIGLVLFVLSRNIPRMEKIKLGLLFGLISYGIYNMTNLATLDVWNWKVAIVDTIWGGVLCALTVYLITFIPMKSN
jgi:uncharacterized membrane protein